nr:retrovirus-related Pol polyprotein from transposon TNT 1-94 [Tanacetum cinerariifolium]
MLSVPQMIKNGYGVNFKNDSRYIITDSRDVKIATLDMENDSYYLKLDVTDASAFSVTEDNSMKWHKRFGHFNYRTLHKASVFSIFKSFKKLVEVLSGSTLRILRTDNYGEYTLNEFEDFIRQQGVIHQVIVPYSPQQNGVFERKNRTVMEMARSILNLHPTVLSPSAVLNIKRSKLDAKARKGIFVSYATESKGYRIYDLIDSKIVINRDVTFDEGVYWDRNMDEVKRHEDTFLNETYHDEVDIPKFDIENTTDTDVLTTRLLVDVYESCNSVIEPESYMDASKHSEWIYVIKTELEMIKENNTWKLVDLPEGKNAIGVDFGDTFALVARHDTIKLLLVIKIHHLDVKSTFLNGELEEEIYVKQPEGFEVVRQKEKVYRLYKAFYGLKQAPKAWYAKIDAHLLNNKFRMSSIDDILVIGSNDHCVKEFKKQMESEFDMSNMGLVSYFLGMEIKQIPNGVHISQRKYVSDMLKKFKMFLCKPVISPLVYKCKLSKDDGKKLFNPTRFRRIVGCLLYLTISRPDLAFATSFLSRFMGEPSSSHLGAAKRVLRYEKGSLDLGIMFKRNKVVKLEGYADSDCNAPLRKMEIIIG